MSLPGLSLPGLGDSESLIGNISSTGISAANTADQPTRTETLKPQTEWRFEAPFQGPPYTIRLLSGQAELFGAELAPKQAYNLAGTKGAVFTWHGCQLEMSGEAESEYVGLETEYAMRWMNVHGMLESSRETAKQGVTDEGPRVLVVGPESSGKTSLIRSLATRAVKMGRTPTVVNFDTREGLLAPPGTFTAVTLGSQIDVEHGYGIAPISGATTTPVQTPLVYHVPYANPNERAEVSKALITRTALIVMNRLEEDPRAKQSGILIDTPSSFNDPKTNYDLLNHVISEFSISIILTLGSERLYNDMTRRHATESPPSPTAVLRISNPGGAVQRDPSFTTQAHARAIREYFFGPAREPLNPHSHTLSFADLTIYRANSAALDAELGPHAADLEIVAPSMDLLNRLLAIKWAAGAADAAAVRNSAVMGFVYVAEVDEAKQRVRFLAPHPQRWGDRALVFGGYPSVVVGMIG